jgi:hypothetical protein
VIKPQHFAALAVAAVVSVALAFGLNAYYDRWALPTETGEALSGLRGRGITDRPFELIDGIRKTAEARFGAKLQALIAKRKETQTKLARMESEGQGGTTIMSDKQRQEIDRYRTEAAATGRELRSVLRAQREDIDSLYARLRFWNIAAVPLAIGVGGLLIGLLRRRRNQSG